MRATALTVLAGALVIGVSVFATGGFDPFVVGVFVASLVPLLVFAIAIRTLAEERPVWRVTSTAIFLALIVVAYLAAAGDQGTDSTSGLIYVVLPIYMLLGAGAAIAVGWVVHRVAGAQRAERPRASGH